MYQDAMEEIPEYNVKQLEGYRDVFTEPDKPLGRMDLVEHGIDTGNELPIKQRLSGCKGLLKKSWRRC
jgi:hypothetical protein